MMGMVSVLLGLSVTFLTGKEKREGFILNILKKILALPTYYEKSLYPKCTLDTILICESIYGWILWGHRGEKSQKRKEISALSLPSILASIATVGIGTSLLGFLYSRYTSSSMPYPDSFHAVLTLSFYFLLAHKKREAWIFAILGNLCYVYICYQKSMFFIIKYCLYVVLSTNALLKWNRIYTQKKRSE